MGATISVRCYAELNDFLPLEKKYTIFRQSFLGAPAIKDLIEAAGIPHTEVDLLLVEGASVAFNYRIGSDCHVSVYPPFKTLDVSALTKVRPKPLGEPRFILDTHLGKLATYLRMAGMDTLYQNKSDDLKLADRSSSEQRILLSRDRGLLKRSAVTHGYLVRSENPREQLAEVFFRFDLYRHSKPFRLCLRCNTALIESSPEDVEKKVPPRVREFTNAYKSCPNCGRVFWKGTHYKNMSALLESLSEMKTATS